MFKPLIRFQHLPLAKKIIFFEAIAWSIVARVLIFVCPFSWTKYILRLKPYTAQPLKNVHTLVQTGQAKTIASLINTLNHYFPWKNTCLVQAITAKMLLKRRGAESVIIMGLKKEDSGALKAHAWLTNVDGVVTGFDDANQFTALAYLI